MVATDPLPLTVQESPDVFGSALAVSPTATDPPSRRPPRTWSSACSPMLWRYGPLASTLARAGPTDLAAMDFLYELGETAAAGGGIRGRLFD